jgi:hypothetical protein
VRGDLGLILPVVVGRGVSSGQPTAFFGSPEFSEFVMARHC